MAKRSTSPRHPQVTVGCQPAVLRQNNSAPVDPLSTLPARPDEDIPSIQDTANRVAAHVVADAIDQFLYAEHRKNVVGSRLEASTSEFDRWWKVADDTAEMARLHVVRAILAWHNRDDKACRLKDPSTIRWPNSGVAYRGKLFAVVVNRDYEHYEIGEGSERGENHQIMHLSLVDLDPRQKVEPDLDAMVDLDQFFNRPKPPARKGGPSRGRS